MIVTNKKYMIEDQLLKKLNLMVKRLKGSDDAVLIIDGDEGQGKTEFAFSVCYYMAHKLKRSYDVDNVFFDLDSMIQFAASTKDQIIHFDEAALGLMRTQWQKESQQKFLQLVMVARKKRHFIVICIPKFHRLPPYALEERSIGLVHVYSHKNIYKGRYCYFNKEAKSKLHEDYEKRKIKSYQKHYSFRGKFVEASKKIFNQEQMDAYEKKKDQAILSVSDDSKPQSKRATKWMQQRNNIIKGLKKDMKISTSQIKKLLEKYNVSLDKSELGRICQEVKVSPPQITALL